VCAIPEFYPNWRTFELELFSFGLVNINNNQPTHFSPTSSTLIDLLFASLNLEPLFYDQIAFPGTSKHDLIFGTFDFDVIRRPTSSDMSYYDFKNINLVELISAANDTPWDLCCSCPEINSRVDLFQFFIHSLFENFVPLKHFCIRDSSNQWFTPDVLAAIRERNQAYSFWKRTRSDAAFEYFRACRKRASSKIKNAKINYFQPKFNSKLNPRILWKNLNKLGLGKRKSCAQDVNGEELNNFFLQNQVPSLLSPSHLTFQERDGSFDFRLFEQHEVLNAVKRIKSNATGADGIHLRFLKLILPCILPTITNIFNFSITCSLFPDSWKVGIVTPVPKIKNPGSLGDFRWITIVPVLSKIFEHPIRNQLLGFIDSNCFLNNYQSGFRNRHSCISALPKITDDISTEMDNNKFTILTCLDFSKAFDSLDHLILCNKLNSSFNFSPRICSFIYSFLHNRSQCVKFNNSLSSFSNIVSGVPQGSVIGPLLFSLFINDLPDVCRNLTIHMYADDVQLYISQPIGLVEDMVCRINEDLYRINSWARDNNLKLNPSKSLCLPIYKNFIDFDSLPVIFLNNSPIPYLSRINNLGVELAHDLSWDYQINRIIGNTYGTLRKLWPIAKFIPLDTRVRLVKTLILPFFTYASDIFCSLNSELERKIIVAFNSACRFAFQLRRFDSISDKVLLVLGHSLISFLEIRSCVTMFKIINNYLPLYLRDKITLFNSNRLSKNIILPF